MPRPSSLMGWMLPTVIPVLVPVMTAIAALPVWALEATFRPANPVLGETISVEIRTVSGVAPTVTFNQKPYPAYPMGEGRYRALLPTTPLDPAGRKTVQVSDGLEQRQLSVPLGARSFATQRIWLPPGKDQLEGSDYEFDQVDAFKALTTPQKFWNGAFLRPAQGPVTTEFGVLRYYNGVFADDYYHRGVDYAGAQGSPVVAPAAGRIALIGREAQGFQIHGNTVGIDHGQGVLSIMIHLSRIDVAEGQMVRPGQTIGAIGSTGASTGPHLHWGLYVNGVAVDPVPWRYGGLE